MNKSFNSFFVTIYYTVLLTEKLTKIIESSIIKIIRKTKAIRII